MAFYSDKNTAYQLPDITQPYPFLPNITHTYPASLSCNQRAKIAYNLIYFLIQKFIL